MGFQIRDTLVEPVSSQSTTLVTIALSSFMAKQRSDRARLVYVGANSSVLQQVSDAARTAGLAVVTSLREYRNLRNNTVYLLRDDHTRGLDFKTHQPGMGIDLLVATPTLHSRQFL